MINIWTIYTRQFTYKIEVPIKSFIKRIFWLEFKSDLNSIVVQYSFDIGHTTRYIIVPNTVTRHRIVDTGSISLNLAFAAAPIIVFNVAIVALLSVGKNRISTSTDTVSVDIYIVAAHANTCMICWDKLVINCTITSQTIDSSCQICRRYAPIDSCTDSSHKKTSSTLTGSSYNVEAIKASGTNRCRDACIAAWDVVRTRCT